MQNMLWTNNVSVWGCVRMHGSMARLWHEAAMDFKHPPDACSTWQVCAPRLICTSQNQAHSSTPCNQTQWGTVSFLCPQDLHPMGSPCTLGFTRVVTESISTGSTARLQAWRVSTRHRESSQAPSNFGQSPPGSYSGEGGTRVVPCTASFRQIPGGHSSTVVLLLCMSALNQSGCMVAVCKQENTLIWG